MSSLDPSRPNLLQEECCVCGATTNVRKNFGVHSCVSCRIFYSRNASKQLICYQNGNCRIEGASRKSCASCRFAKCTRAGMRKSRERRGVRTDIASKAAIDAWAFELRSDQSQSTLTGDLLEHLARMARMFCDPFELPSAELLVNDTRSGLRLLETLTRRALTVIRFLPHFTQLDRGQAFVMVSEKIGGLCAILRCLHYEPGSGQMVMPVAAAGDGASSEARQPLSQTVAGVFSDLIIGERPLLAATDIVALVRGLSRLYEQLRLLFQDRLGAGVMLLLGVYFYRPDFSALSGAEDHNRLRSFHLVHLRWLRELLLGGSDGADGYSRALLLISEVKRVEFYHGLLARHAELSV